MPGSLRRLVFGPTGNVLTVGDLPPGMATRWVAHRKAEVVSAVEGGLLTVEAACMKYKISLDEFLSWKTAMALHGLRGLKVTRARPRGRLPKRIA